MIYALTIASILGSLVLWRMSRRIADKESIKRATVGGALEFVTIFSAVGLLYSVLQYWIDSAKFDNSDLSTIHSMENQIVELRHTLLPILDLSKWIVFGVIVLLALLGIVAPRIGRLRLVPKTKVALKWTRRAYILLTVAASFTFFGSAIAPSAQERTAEIKSKIDEINTGYQTYRAKVDRIARRVVVQSLAKTEPYAQPVTAFDEYVRSRNDAIDRARNRPHSDLIDFTLDADNFDYQYRGEFQRFAGAVREQQHTARDRQHELSVADISEGTLQRAKALNTEADALLVSTEDESDGILAIVEESATILHEETSKRAIESLVSALSGAAAENELFKLLYEPFLQTPVEEFVKQISSKLFENTKYGQASLQSEVVDVRRKADDEAANLAVAREDTKIADISDSFRAASEKMRVFQSEADVEVQSKAKMATQKKLAEFSKEWKSLLFFSHIRAFTERF